MKTEKQFEMVMRDMLFITWAVEPAVVRSLVDQRLELDTVEGSNGPVALVSAVCFRVAEVRSSVLLMPSLSFQQVNYRVYVKSGEVPAVSFLDIKVSSRMVTAITGFMSVPIHHEDIDIKTSAGDAGLLRYKITSAGITAEASIGDQSVNDGRVTPAFITDRFLGYVRVGEGVFSIEVEQPGLDTVPARVQNVLSPRLEHLGVLTPEQSGRPYSVFYVRESLFGASTPARLS